MNDIVSNNIFAMFPGQGAQSIGMGKAFYESSPLAKERFEQAEEALSIPLTKYCLEGPIEKLTETAITQPALLTVSTVAFDIWEQEHGADSIKVAAGHSLGEYSALVAAKAISFTDAVKIVSNRGKFMQEAVPIGAGAMIAVLGQEKSAVSDAIKATDNAGVEIANINAPGQIVLAGEAKAISRFSEENSGWKIKELAVSAPFHCQMMKAAEEKLAPLLHELTINTPRFPVVQNVTAQASNEPDSIRENLIKQVCGSVRWTDCVENALENHHVAAAYEFGTGKVLCGLLKRIRKGFLSKTISAPADVVEV